MVFAEHTLPRCNRAKTESSRQGEENTEHWIWKYSLSGETSTTISDNSASEPSGHVMETATHRIYPIDMATPNHGDIHRQSASGHAVAGVGTGTVQTIILPVDVLKIFTSNTSFSARE
ncbi:hypothetical protein HJC23_004421 [Cyclotella cryptica]|uniref:Uncharacterized protein n=1 Tax=Cyclotella cryptica TaxID=29204 RepID=A0ABD3QER3_9STRA